MAKISGNPKEVSVVYIPETYGARGWGCKISGESLVIPYNPTVTKSYEDVKELVIATMARAIFNNLPVFEEV
jgi:hypothetical protein